MVSDHALLVQSGSCRSVRAILHYHDRMIIYHYLGDGRADYLSVDLKSGAVECYLNGGRNVHNASEWVWLPQPPIATGIGRDGKGVRFADIK